MIKNLSNILGFLSVLVLLSTNSAMAGEALSWSLSRDMMTGIDKNPKGVWSFMQSFTLHDYTQYKLFPSYSKPCLGDDGSITTLTKYNCWQDIGALITSAQIGIKGGANQKVGSFIFPANIPFLHPGSDRSVIVRWKSPIKGEIDLLGRVSQINPCGNGISWFVDLENNTLLSGNIFMSGNTFYKNNIPVIKGSAIYFIIDGNGQHDCDWTNLDILITSQQ